jgi:hypothetical protein
MAVEVTFCIDLGDDCAREQELDRRRDVLLAEEYPHTGEVIIVAPDGVEIAVRDELWAAVQGVCLQAVPSLVAGRRFDYRYLNASGGFALIPVGGVIRIEGDIEPSPVTLPAEGLPAALVSAGERFTSLMRGLGGPYLQMVGTLEPQAAVARAALG